MVRELVMVHYVFMCLYERGREFDGCYCTVDDTVMYKHEFVISLGIIVASPVEVRRLSTASCETWTFVILETRPGENPFHFGSFSNFQAVRGSTIFAWLFPFSLFQLVDIRLAPQPLHLPPRGAHAASHAVYHRVSLLQAIFLHVIEHELSHISCPPPLDELECCRF